MVSPGAFTLGLEGYSENMALTWCDKYIREYVTREISYDLDTIDAVTALLE